MNTLFRRHRALPLCMVTCALCGICVAGCSNEEDRAETVIAEVPPVDPRFVSAESLVQHFNALTTKAPVDVAAALDLFYAENAKQQSLLAMSKASVPIIPLEKAVQARFKESIEPGLKDALATDANSAATITENQGERATATYKDHKGKSHTLQLVRYDGRWWISGYSIEHLPEVKNITDDEIEFALITIRTLAHLAPNLTARVQAGEFKTIAEVRAAAQAGAIQHMQQNQAEAERVRELLTRNPKLIGGADRPAKSRGSP